MQRPKRPEPGNLIDDYDDGDPYSCMAAGAAEQRAQESFANEVLACFPDDSSGIERLAKRDLATTLTALHDLWEPNRDRPGSAELATWAAGQSAMLGRPDLADYDRAHPAKL